MTSLIAGRKQTKSPEQKRQSPGKDLGREPDSRNQRSKFTHSDKSSTEKSQHGLSSGDLLGSLGKKQLHSRFQDLEMKLEWLSKQEEMMCSQKREFIRSVEQRRGNFEFEKKALQQELLKYVDNKVAQIEQSFLSEIHGVLANATAELEQIVERNNKTQLM